MQKYSFSLKSAFFLFLVISSFSFVFAQSQTYLDVNGFCAGFPVQFDIYNESEWENREEIEDDRDLEFTNISATVTIYDGPFESSGELDSFESSENGEFSFTFPQGGNYLVNINPESNNFEELDQIVLMDPCERANKVNEPTIFNTTFTYDLFSTQITFNQINSNSSSDIIITSSDLELLPQLNNSLSAFQISSVNDSINYTSMTIETSLDYENGDILTLYVLEENSWEPAQFTLNDDSITIEDAQLTTYAVTLETPQQTSQEEETSQEETITEIVTQEEIKSENSFLSSKTTLIGIGVVVIFIFVFYMFTSNKKGKISKEEKDFFSNNTNIETVHSYSQTYDKAKNYVKQYKQGYEKEQIKKALIAAQVPEDIIKKIFDEEY